MPGFVIREGCYDPDELDDFVDSFYKTQSFGSKKTKNPSKDNLYKLINEKKRKVWFYQ